MKTARYFKHILEFKQPGGTSRGVLHTKETYILEVFENNRKGVGECAVFRGLSYDDVPEYEQLLKWLCENINKQQSIIQDQLINFPSIWFGYEQAMRNLSYQNHIYFPSLFTDKKDSIKINGLIWMGSVDFMEKQIQEKLENGFSCIKLKIGTNWNSEKEILQKLRKKFTSDHLEIRVDANGAFSFDEAKVVLNELSDLDIHSIEQPIKAGNTELMKHLCSATPTPVALDEELIGIRCLSDKKNLLEKIHPQYIILKPSLVGGFSGCDEWISIAQSHNIGWWITSALESNIGLNAIAQYTYTKKNTMPQGLGTGGLFTNNFESLLNLDGDQLFFK